MNIARSTLKLVLSRILSTPISFIGLAILGRELGPAPMGVYFLYITLVGVLSLVVDFGISGAVEKRLSEGEPKRRILGAAIVLKLALLALSSIAIYLARAPINQYVGTNVASFVILALWVKELGKLYLFAIRGQLRVGETAAIEAGQRITWMSVAVAFALLNYGVTGVIYGYLAGLCLVGVASFYKVRTLPTVPSQQEFSSILSYARYNFVSSAGGYVYNWMDIAILGLFVTQAHVGAYEYAWRVSIFVMFGARSISTVLFPQVSQWTATDDIASIERTIKNSVRAVLFISIPAFFGATILTEDILHYLFGPEFTIAAVALSILMAEKILQSVYTILTQSLEGMDHVDDVAKITIITIALNLALNIALVPTIGIAGAAAATGLSFAVNTGLHVRVLRRYITFSLPWKTIGWSVFGSASMVASLIAYNALIGVGGLPTLILAVGVGATVYFGVTLLIPDTRRKLILPAVRVVL